ARERVGLAAEARDHALVERELAVQDLDRDFAAHDEVGCSVDRAEAAGGELLIDAVAPVEDRTGETIESRGRWPCWFVVLPHALYERTSPDLYLNAFLRAGTRLCGRFTLGIFCNGGVRPRRSRR